MRKDRVHKNLSAGAVLPLLIYWVIFGSNWNTTSSPTLNLPGSNLQSSIQVPSANDWQNGVLAFSHGAGGQWDRYLWGGFANSLIKKGNTYYLYYQGAKSYDNQCDDVTNRAIGGATSTDLVHWTKSPNNPVITWVGSGGSTEGAASSAAWLGQDGKIYLYYGANSQIGSTCYVHANGRLAVSSDGIRFQDMGEVLSSSNSSVWGNGDELFPVGAYSYGGKWYLYYVPNGVSNTGKLGLAIGDSPSVFTQTLGVNNSSIPAWGPVSTILNGSESVLFTNPNGTNGPINIYLFNAGSPSTATLINSYTLENCRQASALYESSTGRWIMACRDATADNYIIRIAQPTGTGTLTRTPTASSKGTTTATFSPTPGNTSTPTFTPIYTPSRTPTPQSTRTPTATNAPKITPVTSPTATPTSVKAMFLFQHHPE